MSLKTQESVRGQGEKIMSTSHTPHKNHTLMYNIVVYTMSMAQYYAAMHVLTVGIVHITNSWVNNIVFPVFLKYSLMML